MGLGRKFTSWGWGGNIHRGVEEETYIVGLGRKPTPWGWGGNLHRGVGEET